MFQNMDKELIELIELSEDIAKKMKANYVGSEHLLLALLKCRKSVIRSFVAKYGMSYNTTREDLLQCYVNSTSNYRAFTKIVEEILNETMQIALMDHRDYAEIRDLEYAILQSEKSVAYELLLEYEVDIDTLIRTIAREKWMNELGKIKELQNLNQKMENEKQIVLLREKEINTITTVLSRKEKANPLLIGEPGIGKSAIVEEIARRIAQKEVPSCLQDIVIYELNINNLVAGTKYRGEFEEKMDKICSAVKKYHNAVLFIDEIHQIVGAGKAEGSIDVATVFKPYLARSEIKVIGATTLNEYTKYIENDRALERRFQTITIQEPRKEEIFPMLGKKVKTLSEYHQVEISEEMVKLAIEESDTYLINRHFPDKTIDILDLAATRAKLKGHKQIEALDIYEIVEELTNIKRSSLSNWNISKLLTKYPSCTKAIDKLKDRYEESEYRFDIHSPKGVYYVASSKREEVCEFTRDVAKSISSIMSYTEIPMNLYNESNSLYYLTSTKEGPFYKPWNDLRKSPQMLFLLQNFDLAHPDVQHFFLRIFELGRWKDSEGKEYDFRNSIFLISKIHQEENSLGLERGVKNQKWMSNADEYILLSPFTRAEFNSYARIMMDNYQMEIAEEVLEDCFENEGSRSEQIRQLKKLLRQKNTNQKA